MDVRVPQKHFEEYYSINVTEGRETGPSNATSDDFVVICLVGLKYTETNLELHVIVCGLSLQNDVFPVRWAAPELLDRHPNTFRSDM